MKAGRDSIRYCWMRRTAQGVALAAGGVALLGSLCAGQASGATQSAVSSHIASVTAIPQAPPPPESCYKSRDGWLWYDLDAGLYYRCVQNILGEWVWVEVGRAHTCPANTAIKPERSGAVGRPGVLERIICSG